MDTNTLCHVQYTVSNHHHHLGYRHKLDGTMTNTYHNISTALLPLLVRYILDTCHLILFLIFYFSLSFSFSFSFFYTPSTSISFNTLPTFHTHSNCCITCFRSQRQNKLSKKILPSQEKRTPLSEIRQNQM